MRKTFATILTLFGAVNGSNEAFSFVTSSLFAMVLSPTFDKLSVDTSASVETLIKESLTSAASIGSSLESLFDIDIVLQQVEWTVDSVESSSEDVPFTTLRFEAHAKFLKQRSASSPPSRFELDSLVVRTFSLPSEKAKFLDKLWTLEEPSLDSVDAVAIAVANVGSEGPVEPETSHLSLLDILLISASALIFLGMMYVMHQHYKDQADFSDQQVRALSDWHQRRRSNEETSDIARSESQEAAQSLNMNVAPAESTDVGASPRRSIDPDNIVYLAGSLDEESADGVGSIEADVAPNPRQESSPSTPPISNGSSVLSSPVEKTSSIGSSRLSVYSSEGDNAMSESPYRLGAPPPLYPMVDESSRCSSEASPLTARLLRLPMLDSPGSGGRSVASVISTASAPTILVGWTSKRGREDFSTSSRVFSSPTTPRVTNCGSRDSSTNITELAVTSSRTLLSEYQTFKNDWDVATRRAAMAGEEEGSEEDVFCVDVDAHSNAEDIRSRMSGLSAVSDWMKSVRVVSSPGTNTSETSHTSAEHSSVEPRSLQMQDAISIDGSLERSLAASIIAD